MAASVGHKAADGGRGSDLGAGDVPLAAAIRGQGLSSQILLGQRMPSALWFHTLHHHMRSECDGVVPKMAKPRTLY